MINDVKADVAKANFDCLLEEATQGDNVIQIDRGKQQDVVLMSSAEYETLRIMSNPQLMTKIHKGDSQIARGEAKTHELIQEK
jgi:PHD/YefM family antitoxin component YafN of YafNO toxin-antitoxin module